jgi:uncharacterized membrane protein (DUF2068 family)
VEVGGTRLVSSRRVGPTRAGRPWQVVLIAAEKGISTLAILAAAIFAFVLHGHPWEHPVTLLFSRRLAHDPHNVVIRWLIRHVPYISPGRALVFGIALIFWAGVFAAETAGVWLQAAWGELLVIVETALFLPVQVWNIARRPHPFEFVTMPINLLILGYLIQSYRRRLGRRRPRASGAALSAPPRP